MEATIFDKRRRSSSSNTRMHKHSYSITKSKPKIRIIHIFAPEIIKTDVANFRELVQSLTGKPDDQIKTSKTKPRRDIHHRQVQEKLREPEHYDQGFYDEEISMTWNGGNNGVGESSGGFGLGDFEGLIQELGEFPYLPLSSSMDGSGSSNSSSSSRLLGGFSDAHHQFA